MENNTKTIGISSLIALGIMTLSMITPGFFDEPSYYCDTRPELGIQQCDNFSKYIADNGKCIINDAPNLICKSGWLLVTDDSEYTEPDVVIDDNVNMRMSCNKEGCVEI